VPAWALCLHRPPDEGVRPRAACIVPVAVPAVAAQRPAAALFVEMRHVVQQPATRCAMPSCTMFGTVLAHCRFVCRLPAHVSWFFCDPRLLHAALYLVFFISRLRDGRPVYSRLLCERVFIAYVSRALRTTTRRPAMCDMRHHRIMLGRAMWAAKLVQWFPSCLRCCRE
jgi:hypothetical protein